MARWGAVAPFRAAHWQVSAAHAVALKTSGGWWQTARVAHARRPVPVLDVLPAALQHQRQRQTVPVHLTRVQLQTAGKLSSATGPTHATGQQCHAAVLPHCSGVACCLQTVHTCLSHPWWTACRQPWLYRGEHDVCTWEWGMSSRSSSSSSSSSSSKLHRCTRRANRSNAQAALAGLGGSDMGVGACTI